MNVVVVTPPPAVLDLEMVKAHLRVEDDGDDVLIEASAEAAVAHLDAPDGWLGRALGRQTLEVTLDCFPITRCGSIALPYPPLHEIVSVKYDDADGVEQTIDDADYVIVPAHGVRPAFGRSWPATRAFPGAVRVRFVAGYETLPAPIRAAVLLMTGDLYANRETGVVGTVAAEVKMSTTVENLLAPYRVWS